MSVPPKTIAEHREVTGMRNRDVFRICLSMVVASLSVFSVLWLAGCSGSTDPEVAEGTVASVVLSPDGIR